MTIPSSPRIGSVRSDGCDLYYEELGEGLPILLVHPAGATASTWGSATEELARVGRVIAYDRRGYARSGGEQARSIFTHTTDAAAILESLRAQPAVVVGTSAGAAIAVDLAVRRPDLVRVVVAHEFPWRFTRHLPSVSQIARWPRSGRSRSAADRVTQPKRCCAPPTPTVTVAARGMSFPRSGGGPAGKTPSRPWRTSAIPSPTIRPRRISRPSVPVVCSYGALSPDSMIRLVRSLAAAIPTARTHQIEGAGHAATFDATANFVQLVADTMTSSDNDFLRASSSSGASMVPAPA